MAYHQRVGLGDFLGLHRTRPGKLLVETEINPRYSDEPYKVEFLIDFGSLLEVWNNT